MNALGEPGTAKRRFLYGPSAQNYDMAIAKSLPFTESKSLLFRAEAFNVFNHTQFNGPKSVDGDVGSTTFGQVISAPPYSSRRSQVLVLKNPVETDVMETTPTGDETSLWLVNSLFFLSFPQEHFS
jgi:hypothetical protein